MIVAYLRVSTEKQHLENQKAEIKNYANKHNLNVDRWIEEKVSGKTNRNSRKLGKIINNLNKGDTLIVTEISRLSRSLHEIMMIMKQCVETGVIIYSTKDGYTFDDSLNSKVLSFAFGLAAEIEHKLISQRTKEALAVKKAEGKHIGRGFGTDIVYKNALLNKTKIISMINDGATIVSICKKFKFSNFLFTKLRTTVPQISEALKNRQLQKNKTPDSMPE